MMAYITMSVAEIYALRPCRPRLNALPLLFASQGRFSASDAVEVGAFLSDLVWAASKLADTNPEASRCIRLWAADCAARSLPFFEREKPLDRRVRDAITAARKFARGSIPINAARFAKVAALDSARSVVTAAASCAANAAALASAGGASAGILFSDAAWEARSAFLCAKNGIAAEEAEIAEEQWQKDRFCAWFSAEEPEDWPLANEEGR